MGDTFDTDLRNHQNRIGEMPEDTFECFGCEDHFSESELHSVNRKAGETIHVCTTCKQDLKSNPENFEIWFEGEEELVSKQLFGKSFYNQTKAA